jgi:D-alanyl-D-alanine carboxypeptidase
MFEGLVNLVLTSMFLDMQVEKEISLQSQEYMLPQAELREVRKKTPQRIIDATSAGVEVTAYSALAVDRKTGKVLYQKNAEEVRSIASITKLMTALVFLDHNPGWDKEITISSDDYREGGITYLIAGERISVRDLFYATLVASANEGAVALARTTGLTQEEFVSAMNAKAKELGMASTHFVDPTGLSDYNQSTAVDIIILAKRAFIEDSIYSATSKNSYQLYIINKDISRTVTNTNRILREKFGVDSENYLVEAGKTGYLKRAGYCFTSLVSDDRGDEILTVVLGSSTIDNRFVDTKSLAYWVFDNYIWQ